MIQVKPEDEPIKPAEVEQPDAAVEGEDPPIAIEDPEEPGDPDGQPV